MYVSFCYRPGLFHQTITLITLCYSVFSYFLLFYFSVLLPSFGSPLGRPPSPKTAPTPRNLAYNSGVADTAGVAVQAWSEGFSRFAGVWWLVVGSVGEGRFKGCFLIALGSSFLTH